MIVIDNLNELKPLKCPVVTSGTFDGVHYGHRQILKRVIKEAKNLNGQSVVLTYWPHPRFVLGGDPSNLKLLSTIDEKIELLSGCGIDYLIKLEFNREFSELSSDQFIKSILLESIGVKKLIIGYDHKFGKDREGGFDYLKSHQSDYGFDVEEISKQEIDDVGVSSTKIRQALSAGDIQTANHYLGYEYEISGIVTKGDQIGRKMGFPTANIYMPFEHKLIPLDGAYAVRIKANDQKLKGMLNIGVRPTVKGLARTIEVNIFDFDSDIYGRPLTVQFVKKLRNEAKFESLEDLKLQLSKDKILAQEILNDEKV